MDDNAGSENRGNREIVGILDNKEDLVNFVAPPAVTHFDKTYSEEHKQDRNANESK